MKIVKFSLFLLAVLAIGAAIGIYAGRGPKVVLSQPAEVIDQVAGTEIPQAPAEQKQPAVKEPGHERATVDFHFEPVLAAQPNKQ